MRLGFVIFALVAGGLLYLANRHALAWASRAFGLSPRVRRWLGWGLLAALLGMFASRTASWFGAGPLVTAAVAISSTLELSVLITVALLLPLDGARWVARGVASVRAWLRLRNAPASPEPAGGSAVLRPPAAHRAEPRREFLVRAAAGSAFLIGGSSSLYGALAGRHDYTVEEVPVRLDGLSRAFDGFTIVQLSDIHIGQFVGEPELFAAEELVRNARPDLIVLTGDLLDHDDRLAGKLGSFARRLAPRARYGVVAVPGNHDFFAGIDPVEQALEAAGARVLRNRSEVIGDAQAGFALLGVDDVWARRLGGGPDLPRATRALPMLGGKIAPARDLPSVLLCHNPSFFAEAAGRVNLQLSGHTHGGQVNLFVRPADLILPGGWVAGRYEQSGSELYVNRGFGTVGPPARIGSPPEITRLVLVAS